MKLPLQPRWTYASRRGLVQWYGNVEYRGSYVVGQWFALDAATGRELWSRNFHRPNTIRAYGDGMIVASETRSDGPWTMGFGIYGICAGTGELLWTNHARGFWGRLLRCLDYVPGYTNEFRDSPLRIVDERILTAKGRLLEITSGRDCGRTNVPKTASVKAPSREAIFYREKIIKIGPDTLAREGGDRDFSIVRRDREGRVVWRFCAGDFNRYVDGNYYSYRLHGDSVLVVLRDGPSHVPIDPAKPIYVRPNPANHELAVLRIDSGACTVFSLSFGERRKECRIEAIRGTRLLLGCDRKDLGEFEVPLLEECADRPQNE